MRTTEQQTFRIIQMRDRELARRKSEKKKWLAAVPAAACLFMTAAFVFAGLSTGLFAGFSSKSGDAAINDEGFYDENPQYTENAANDDVPDGYNYGSCSLDGVKYTSVKTELDSFYIGKLLASGCESYKGTGADRHNVKCDIYSVKLMDSAFGVAVKYEDSDKYFLTFSYDYKPQTLGEIFDGLGLSEYLSGGMAEIISYPQDAPSYKTQTDLSPEVIALLFSDRAAVPIAEPECPVQQKIIVTMKNPAVFGSNTMTVSVCDNGTVRFVFCGISLVFQSDAAEFINALETA